MPGWPGCENLPKSSPTILHFSSSTPRVSTEPKNCTKTAPESPRLWASHRPTVSCRLKRTLLMPGCQAMGNSALTNLLFSSTFPRASQETSVCPKSAPTSPWPWASHEPPVSCHLKCTLPMPGWPGCENLPKSSPTILHFSNSAPDCSVSFSPPPAVATPMVGPSCMNLSTADADDEAAPAAATVWPPWPTSPPAPGLMPVSPEDVVTMTNSAWPETGSWLTQRRQVVPTPGTNWITGSAITPPSRA
mmetsp:Transcript_20741/g.67229  ORF Transcript_20741/g.67229 Transcript_20741/m.67229 type:complete len:247 (-) Transcript_20741:102-842(-)